MTTPVPFTELEAVNVMLAAIGEAPVNSLSGSTTEDVIQARQTLKRVQRLVLVEGWNFNTEEEYPLTPDVDGFITKSSDMVQVTYKDTGSYRIIEKGARLYDKLNHTFVFTETIYADIVFYVPFEDLPEPARHYIFICAAREFQEETLGAESLSKFQAKYEAKAWSVLCKYDDNTGRRNMFNTNSSQHILNRRLGQR